MELIKLIARIYATQCDDNDDDGNDDDDDALYNCSFSLSLCRLLTFNWPNYAALLKPHTLTQFIVHVHTHTLGTVQPIRTVVHTYRQFPLPK